jgi:ribosomal protein S18 acetylase RimI-like enzyme
MHLPPPETSPTVAADVPGLRLVLEHTGLFPVEALDDMLASFLAFEGPERWLTARLDGAPVGFAFFRPEAHTDGTWNVLAIAVLPEHQNSGIGSQLMERIEDILRRDRQRVLLVETSGTPAYEATRAFYRARHYTEVGRIPEY